MYRKLLLISIMMALLAVPMSIIAGQIPSPVPPKPPPIQSTYPFGPEETVYGVTVQEGWFKKMHIQHDWHYAYYMNCHTVSKHFLNRYGNGQMVKIDDALDETNSLDIINISSHYDWSRIALSAFTGSNYCSVTITERP
ncbi:MAG: hypothetical protein P9M14_01645 [Candidatus Alcyoniella australis]|nr:hypothetical protein [Candidatus Alcyoniella australis]